MEITKEWIHQYNKKCAEFLGWKNKGMVNLELWVATEYQYGLSTNELQFHSDWNWIMKVIEKIEEKDYMYAIVKGASSIWKYEDQNTPIFMKALDDSLTSTIQVIDQFLDWYNKQKEL